MPLQLNEGIFLVFPQRGMQEGSELSQQDSLVILCTRPYFTTSRTPEKVSLPSLGRKETKYKFLETDRPFKLKSTKLLALYESQYVS